MYGYAAYAPSAVVNLNNVIISQRKSAKNKIQKKRCCIEAHLNIAQDCSRCLSMGMKKLFILFP